MKKPGCLYRFVGPAPLDREDELMLVLAVAHEPRRPTASLALTALVIRAGQHGWELSTAIDRHYRWIEVRR